jgi:hypothetical protein|nr:hypothetical protein OH826_17410 [Streptomyces sp. NBC_00899]
MEGSGTQRRVPPPELADEARRNPGGWVYEIDGDMVADPYGDVPPEAVIGAWKVDRRGALSGEYEANPNYRPPQG